MTNPPDTPAAEVAIELPPPRPITATRSDLEQLAETWQLQFEEPGDSSAEIAYANGVDQGMREAAQQLLALLEGTTETFVSIPEIADLAGVKVATIELWRHRRSERKLPWPEEDDAIGPHPIWRLERIRAWLEATGRDYFEDRWREKRAAGGYRRPAARESAKAAYRRRTQQ